MFGWWQRDEQPNGSKAVSLLLRLSTLILLALTSAVTMATAVDCTVTYRDYGALVYLVGSNIAAAVLGDLPAA